MEISAKQSSRMNLHPGWRQNTRAVTRADWAAEKPVARRHPEPIRSAQAKPCKDSALFLHRKIQQMLRYAQDNVRPCSAACASWGRKGFAFVALMVLVSMPLRAAGKLSNPFFVFDDGLGPKTVPLEVKVAMVKRIGFDGVELDGAQGFQERLETVDKAGMRLFCLYVGVNVGNGQTAYEPGMEQAIRLLKGRKTLIWLTVRGGGPSAEKRAVDAVRKVCDWAAQSGLRVALYPHCGMYVSRPEEALRIVYEVKRKNLGMTFNLCHWLMCDSVANLRSVLQESMPHLFVVSINGADHHGDWSRLIQPLGSGSYDVEGFLKLLISLGYHGPIGLQCYQIPGDPETNLSRSMRAWREMSARVAAEVPEAKSDSGSM
jgi:sugar phosphate isomerase/epimerase